MLIVTPLSCFSEEPNTALTGNAGDTEETEESQRILGVEWRREERSNVLPCQCYHVSAGHHLTSIPVSAVQSETQWEGLYVCLEIPRYQKGR